jgi:PAS domain S-box-containing protein
LKKRPCPPSPDEGKYFSIYKHSAVSLWEEDISAVRSTLKHLRNSGVTDVSGFFNTHAEELREVVRSIKVIEVNDATLALYEAERKEQLLGSLDITIDTNLDPIVRASLTEMICAIDEGRKAIQTESAARTLRGNPLSLIVQSYIPAEDDAYPNMLVSLIDITQLKKAEAEVGQLQKRIEFILGATKTGLDIIDAQFFLRFVDPERRKIYGNPMGKKCYEYYWSAQGVCAWCTLPSVFQTRTTSVTEEVLTKEGNRPVQVTAVPFQDESGEWLVADIWVDISERKRTESELLMERALLSALMENLPDPIYFKDTETRFVRTNKAQAERFHLRDGSEAIGKTDQDFFSDEHARKAYEDELGIMRTGQPLVNIEEKETWPDRPDTWVVTTKMPLRDPNGKVLGTFGVSRDITKRKQLEEKNRELATLVDSTNDAIVGIGLDSTITFWNKGAERIYGYTADEILGQSISLLGTPEFEEKTALVQERLARGERIDRFETVLRRKDGVLIDVSVTWAFILDSEGRATGMSSVARDITAEKAIQAQIQRAQRLESLATLASGIAHQFNNINVVVKGYLDMIQHEGNLPGRLSTYVKGATKGIEKAVDITDRLLALTAPKVAEPKPVRLETLARSILILLEPRFTAEKVALILQLEETPLVLADESRLQFVVSCLLLNALDALAEQPSRSITIRNGRRPDAVFLEVSDTGCGISAENLPRLFTPFFTTKGEWAASGSPQANLRGVGMSLSVSNATITEYGGRIEVQSAPGNGSTFRLLMPFIDKNE